MALPETNVSQLISNNWTYWIVLRFGPVFWCISIFSYNHVSLFTSIVPQVVTTKAEDATSMVHRRNFGEASVTTGGLRLIGYTGCRTMTKRFIEIDLLRPLDLSNSSGLQKSKKFKELLGVNFAVLHYWSSNRNYVIMLLISQLRV